MANTRTNAAQAPGRQGGKIRESREVILDATMRCLVRYGYAETRTTSVFAEAGVVR